MYFEELIKIHSFEIFQLKKTIYNDKHDISIYGYEVELYVQNETETHFSSGVYSVLFNEWSNEPKKEDVSIDKELLQLVNPGFSYPYMSDPIMVKFDSIFNTIDSSH